MPSMTARVSLPHSTREIGSPGTSAVLQARRAIQLQQARVVLVAAAQDRLSVSRWCANRERPIRMQPTASQAKAEHNSWIRSRFHHAATISRR